MAMRTFKQRRVGVSLTQKSIMRSLLTTNIRGHTSDLTVLVCLARCTGYVFTLRSRSFGDIYLQHGVTSRTRLHVMISCKL